MFNNEFKFIEIKMKYFIFSILILFILNCLNSPYSKTTNVWIVYNQVKRNCTIYTAVIKERNLLIVHRIYKDKKPNYVIEILYNKDDEYEVMKIVSKIKEKFDIEIKSKEFETSNLLWMRENGNPRIYRNIANYNIFSKDENISHNDGLFLTKNVKTVLIFKKYVEFKLIKNIIEDNDFKISRQSEKKYCER